MMRFLRGFLYAFRGIGFCLTRERNFRFHVAAAVYVLLLAPYFLTSRMEWAILSLTIGAVCAAEAFNTAIEKAVDLHSTRPHPTARAAKDVAAGAVLLCALAAVGVGLAFFTRPQGWTALLQDFSARIYKPVLLLLSLPLAGWLVFRRYPSPPDKP